MATETVLSKLTINSVESREVYKAMQEKGLINEDELYLVSGDAAGEDYFAKPTGGSTGQVLTKTSTGEVWADVPSTLPTVTTSDNGKILIVSGGKWTAATLPKYTGGVS